MALVLVVKVCVLGFFGVSSRLERDSSKSIANQMIAELEDLS